MTETHLIEDLRRLSPPSSDWLFALVALALAGLAAWWRVRRRARPLAPASAGPDPAPDLWSTTLTELERLLPLLRPDQSRAYGIASTALLRRYVEGRYQIAAPRLATEEFLASARHSPALPGPHRDSLGEYLRLCDLLKFGRSVAESQELRELHAAAVDFVTASRPAPDAARPANGGTSR